MNFAAVGPTIDALEVCQVAVAIVCLLGFLFLIRQSWGELRWAMEDHVSFMRWLGVVRFSTVFLYGVALVLSFANILVQLTVPSGINLQESALDVLAAVMQRVTSTIILLIIGAVMLLDHVLRNRAVTLREESVIVPVAAVDADAPTPETVMVVPSREGQPLS